VSLVLAYHEHWGQVLDMQVGWKGDSSERPIHSVRVSKASESAGKTGPRALRVRILDRV